jgi:hypothetical protein
MMNKKSIYNFDIMGLKKEITDLKWLMGAGCRVCYHRCRFCFVISMLNTIVAKI